MGTHVITMGGHLACFPLGKLPGSGVGEVVAIVMGETWHWNPKQIYLKSSSIIVYFSHIEFSGEYTVDPY